MKNYCYLFNGAHTTYAGLIYDNDKGQLCIRFRGMNIENARNHIHFNNLVTNKDDTLDENDKVILERCKKLCDNAYKVDIGLGYQVKEGRV